MKYIELESWQRERINQLINDGFIEGDLIINDEKHGWWRLEDNGISITIMGN